MGEALRLKRLAEDAGAHAARRQQDFDDKVILAELARDAKWQSGARVVETWHPGNAAYARQRQSQIAAAHIAAMRESSRCGFVLPLRIGKPALLARMRENAEGIDKEEMASFFLAVAAHAEEAASKWGAAVLPALLTDGQSAEETLAAALAILAKYGINANK